ncbi:MAG: hypothetical protein JXK04_05435 [Campylobacterales bacterium]|nr:hypothetical protein [Campylobacterales bacterium]
MFLMPDQQSAFAHFLARALKEAPEQILIVAPSFHHTEIKKEILKAARKGSRIVLVTQNLHGDPLSLVQYANTELYTYDARPLQGSVIVIGNRLLCTLPTGIEGETFGRDASLVRCSDDPSEAAAYRSALIPLLKRSKKYLE